MPRMTSPASMTQHVAPGSTTRTAGNATVHDPANSTARTAANTTTRIAARLGRRVRRHVGLLAVLAAAGGFGAATPAQAEDGFWLHIRVQESREDGDLVRINLPFSMVEALIPMIGTDDLSDGRIRIDGHDIRAEDLRRIWTTVKDAPDGDFVTVESRDESVRVAKEAGKLLIKVDQEGRRKHEQVEITVPMTVVDALLSGERDELDLMAGLTALREEGEGVLVTVDSDEEQVQIWIDRDQNSNE